MSKEPWDSFKEWLPAVPGRWYSMLQNVILPLIPLVVAVAIAIQQSVKGLPVPIWDWVLMIVSAVAFVVLSFLAFHRMRLERDKVTSDSDEQKVRRQERREWRQKLSDRLEIPILLFKMYERAKTLCEENKKSLDDESWKAIVDSLAEAHQTPAIMPSSLEQITDIPAVIAILDSIPALFDIAPSPATSVIENVIEKFKGFVLSVQATMSLRGIGAIPLTKNDPEYHGYYAQVKLLQNNLPTPINTKINDCILLSNGFASVLCMDISSTTGISIPAKFLILTQYMTSYMDTCTQEMRDKISAMIEGFLLGE
jgi:hypothetical protein